MPHDPSRASASRLRLRAAERASRGVVGTVARAFEFRRLRALAAAVALPAALSGCVTLPPPPAPHPLDDASGSYAIAVVPARHAPVSVFVSQSAEPGAASQEALKGAGVGALGSAAMLGVGAIVFPPLGVPLAIAMTPIMIGGGAIGGAIKGSMMEGAASKLTPEQREALIRTLAGTFPDPRLSTQMATAVVDDVLKFSMQRAEALPEAGPASPDDRPDYRPLHDRGFGGALEVRVTQIGFTGTSDATLALFATAEARLVDTASGKATWLRGMVYESPTHALAFWLKDDAAQTRAEVGRATRTLGGRVVDLVVLATEPSAAGEAKSGVDSCGVPLLDPKPYMRSDATSGRQDGATISTGPLNPLLAWEPVPREWDRVVPSRRWDRAKDLRYDLRIWKALDGGPGDLVYERIGLAGTGHRVETALDPATTYYWSVRLRYTLDGRAKAAPWSLSGNRAGELPFPKGARFYASAVGGDLVREPCAWEDSVTCACADYLPPALLYWFRTP